MESNAAPKCYLDFHPPGQPDVQFKPAQKVIPENTASRRAHMDAFFKHMGRGSRELQREKKVAVESACWHLHSKRQPKIGAIYFDRTVDYILWNSLFDDLREAGADPKWPWNSIILSRTDMTGGESQVYAAYLEAKKAKAKVAKAAAASPANEETGPVKDTETFATENSENTEEEMQRLRQRLSTVEGQLAALQAQVRGLQKPEPSQAPRLWQNPRKRLAKAPTLWEKPQKQARRE